MIVVSKDILMGLRVLKELCMLRRLKTEGWDVVSLPAHLTRFTVSSTTGQHTGQMQYLLLRALKANNNMFVQGY